MRAGLVQAEVERLADEDPAPAAGRAGAGAAEGVDGGLRETGVAGVADDADVFDRAARGQLELGDDLALLAEAARQPRVGRRPPWRAKPGRRPPRAGR